MAASWESEWERNGMFGGEQRGGGREDPYCTAGALCWPPLKRGGKIRKLALEEAPNCWIATPAVPAALEEPKGSASCQHSRTDSPLWVAIAVSLRKAGEGAVMVVATRKARTETRADRMVGRIRSVGMVDDG